MLSCIEASTFFFIINAAKIFETIQAHTEITGLIHWPWQKCSPWSLSLYCFFSFFHFKNFLYQYPLQKSDTMPCRWYEKRRA
jgi:hypothetical protein